MSNGEIPSYDQLMATVQNALTAVGEIERAVGAFEDDRVHHAARPDLNEAVNALHRVRTRLSETIGRG